MTSEEAGMGDRPGVASPASGAPRGGGGRLQRVVQVAVAGGLLLVVLGGLKHDVVSEGVAGRPGSELWVEYPRLASASGPATLRVHAGAASATAPRDVYVWIEQRYLEGTRLVEVSPQPADVTATSERITYRFRFEPRTAPMVTFTLNPDQIGRQEVAIGLANGPRVLFTQSVYP